ncbi:MAG: hypothetical protein AAFQ58_06675 [Pseudomonadota bacterium]
MLKLFAKSTSKAETAPQMPYTRFGEGGRRTEVPRTTRFEARDTVRNPAGGKTTTKPFSGFATEPRQPEQAQHPRVDQTSDPAAGRPAAPAPIDDAAHLHSTDHIPLWVLRKALPRRFKDTPIGYGSRASDTQDEFLFR